MTSSKKSTGLDWDAELSAALAAETEPAASFAKQAGTHRSKPRRQRFVDFSRAQATAAQIVRTLPAENEQLHFLIDPSFSAAALVPHIAQLLNRPVHLIVATLGINEPHTRLLIGMLQNRQARTLRVIFSNYFAAADRQACEEATRALTDAGAQVLTTRIHAKLQLYRPAGDPRRFVVTTSANLRTCRCIETATLAHDRRLYEFHSRWIHRLFNESNIVKI